MPKSEDAPAKPAKTRVGDGGRRIRLPTGLDALEALIPEIEGFSAEHGLDASAAFALNVALDELVNNVVSYGLRGGEGHFLEVRMRVAGGRLEVEVEDDGVAFDPFERAAPDTDLPLEERSIGGLGIEIVRQLMDEARYERQGNRNLVTLRRSLGERE
ncbi:MAG TPA: ATP-binding protein [Thermoanaerobaculia bacterium]|nr:ATP-binding protein [Thermoanaerobaculia bacterium]